MEPNLGPELLFPAVLAFGGDVARKGRGEDVGPRKREWVRVCRMEEGELGSGDGAGEEKEGGFLSKGSDMGRCAGTEMSRVWCWTWLSWVKPMVDGESSR